MGLNPFSLVGKIAELIFGMSALREDVRGLRVDLQENTSATRENTAALRSDIKKAIEENTAAHRASTLRSAR